MMDIWNNFYIRHMGILEEADAGGYTFYTLETLIRDKKTKYDVVSIYTSLEGKTLYISINSNEKMLKRLKLPTYKHHANFSYIEDKKNFDQKKKKGRNIPCLSLGAGNVGKVIKSIVQVWREAGYTVKNVCFYRETGATVSLGERTYSIRDFS